MLIRDIFVLNIYIRKLGSNYKLHFLWKESMILSSGRKGQLQEAHIFWYQCKNNKNKPTHTDTVLIQKETEIVNSGAKYK